MAKQKTQISFNRARATKLIELHGRTRKWLADACGITERSLGAILTGRANPSAAVVKLLAIALETTETDLIEATDAA